MILFMLKIYYIDTFKRNKEIKKCWFSHKSYFKDFYIFLLETKKKAD